MPTAPILSGLVLALALAAPLAAQELARLETLSGSVYEGEVLSDDGSQVEIRTTEGMTLTLPYEQLTPESQYHLKHARAQDGQAHLELAEWCVDQTLYREAKREYRAALEADPELSDAINKSLTAARKQAADELVARAKKLAADGKTGEARQILAAVVQELPLEDAAKEASQLLAEETHQRKQASLTHERAPKRGKDAPQGPVPTRADGQPFSEDAQKTMAPVVEAYKKILDCTQEGLQSSQQGTSIKEYEKGIKEGEKARKAVDKVRPESQQDEELGEAVALADRKLEEALVDLRIYLADAYMLRTSYDQADDVIKQGLAEYPRNERLQRASERVVSAASSDDGGGWVVGRRPGGGLRR